MITEAQNAAPIAGLELVVRLPSSVAIEAANASQAGVAAALLRVGEGAALSFTGSLEICVALHPIDLRKSFNGLHGMVTERLGIPAPEHCSSLPTSCAPESRFVC